MNRDHESEDDGVMKERDDAIEQIDKILDLVLGIGRREWSSAYTVEDAIIEVDYRMFELESGVTHAYCDPSFRFVRLPISKSGWGGWRISVAAWMWGKLSAWGALENAHSPHSTKSSDYSTKNETEYLELISDKIRKGEPVGFLEAIAAINYQGHLQAEREANRWYRRIGRCLSEKFRRTTP